MRPLVALLLMTLSASAQEPVRSLFDDPIVFPPGFMTAPRYTRKELDNLSTFGPPPYDAGGPVDWYVEDAKAFGRTPRVISGTCLSACTLTLTAPNPCVVETAILWFHGSGSQALVPAFPGSKAMLPDPSKPLVWNAAITNDLLKRYPAVIQEWAKRTKALSTLQFSRDHTLTGKQLIAMGFRQCTKQEVADYEPISGPPLD